MSYDEYKQKQFRNSVWTRQNEIYSKRCQNAIKEVSKHWKQEYKILDAGCGDGYSMDIIRDLGFVVVGVDLHPDKCAIAHNHGHTVYNCDLDNIPIKDGQFNIIYCRHTIEHLINPLQTLEEFYRLLINGGLLYIIAPIELRIRGKHPHLIPNKEYIDQLIQIAGFVINDSVLRDEEGGQEVWIVAIKRNKEKGKSKT